MTRIPKIVYQTWRTKNDIPEYIKKQRNDMIKLNPNYKFILYDNDDMEKFVHENFDNQIIECWNRINIMTAKADFWRYLILYKYGGIYLDFDDIIKVNLDSFITDEEDVILLTDNSFKLNNKIIIGQEILFVSKNNPVLKLTIDIVISNIKYNKFPNSIWNMTGPHTITEALQHFYKNEYNEELIFDKKNISKILSLDNYIFHIYFANKIKRRVTGKHKLYDNEHLHWKKETKPLLK